MARIPNVVCAVVFFFGAALAARAEQATITLSPDEAVWNDTVEVKITGVGCTGAVSEPSLSYLSGGSYAIDIDLLDCPSGSTAPFSTVVELGPIAHEEYLVRVHNAIRHVVSPPPPPLDTEMLTVYQGASFEIDVAETPTDAAPFTLVLRGSTSSPCYFIDPPEVSGKTIVAAFDSNCPILPPIGPTLFEESFEIGTLPAGEYDVRFFDLSYWPEKRLYRKTITVHDADGCVPSATALCLQNDRFRVEVDWKDFEGHTGAGRAVPLASGDESGLFWFFDEANVELTVKVLDGCSYNQGWWVFISSGSTVEYSVTVTDTKTGQSKVYENDLGEAAPLVADTAAFSCAP